MYYFLLLFFILLIKRNTAQLLNTVEQITLHCYIVHNINIVYSMCCPSEPQLHECTAVI